MTLRARTAATLLPLAVLLAACGPAGGPADGPADAPATDGAPDAAEVTDGGTPLQVVAAFYPLEHLVRTVGGEHVEVSTLTAPGIDPHDVELTPRQVAGLGEADLVVYQDGMQAAVDAAVQQQAPDHSLDVVPAADLILLDESEQEHAEHAGEPVDDTDHGEDEGQAEHADGDTDDSHDHGTEDPHFWLDPQRYDDVAQAVVAELARLDPAHADDYAVNGQAFSDVMSDLDARLAEGLATCESRDVVTTHEAFGYLGARYDLHVVGITGVSPESEPSPARLAEVTELVRELGVGAVYTEPLLPEAIARTVAQETGTRVLVLDPADGIGEGSVGEDYESIMLANLETLREGQGCS
ncbi:metal ABC transporter substrate-binding protein [Ornithinimicrobium sp. W1665]|uniref:metal ABC transporter substrate-binding protein n=1 Tax=Ornithinimicrobium sp. W1665 TaxID=3416666 RepID=UPI003CF19777